jgi:hypothetical protein
LLLRKTDADVLVWVEATEIVEQVGEIVQLDEMLVAFGGPEQVNEQRGRGIEAFQVFIKGCVVFEVTDFVLAVEIVGATD